MRKYIQAGALFVLIALPALVFVFLKLFGRNHFEVPRYNPVTNAAGEIMKIGKDTVFRAVESIEMQDAKNAKVVVPDAQNISVLAFVDDSCDADCQKRQKQLMRLQEMFSADRSVQLYTIVAGNSNEKLAKFAATYKAKTPQWQFVQTSFERVASFKSKEIFLKNPTLTKTFDFDKSFVLIDKKHFIRGFYDGTKPEDVDRLSVEIKILLDNYKE